MATSGTVTFTVNQIQLITAALIECGVIDPENTATPTTTAITNAQMALNMMLKAWEADGLHLWEKRYAAVFLQYNQGYYVFGSPGPAGDHATISTPLGTGFVSTTALGGSGTTLVVASASTVGTPGLAAITAVNGWFIGIQQTDGTYFWTTIANISGTTITLTAGPTVGNVTNAIVYMYQTKLWKPLRINDGFVRQNNTLNSDVPCMIISKEQWNRFGQKGSTGTSIQIMYDPQLNSGIMELYPVPNANPGILYIEVAKPIDDITATTDNFDIPNEWIEAIKFNLALRLCTPYGVPQQKRTEIMQNAMASYAAIEAWDQEQASFFISPNNWDYYGTAR